MRSSPVNIPLDLFAPPRRVRSPRVAIVFLPLTLALVALFCIVRLALRLIIAVALSIWRAVGNAALDSLILLGLWFGVLVVWWLIWVICINIADVGAVQLGYSLCVYWPWQFDDRILGLLHLAATREWWGNLYGDMARAWFRRETSWLMLLTPLQAPVLVACVAFLFRLPRQVWSNTRRVLAQGLL